MRFSLVFLVVSTVLLGCKPIREKHLSGDWIIESITFEGRPIQVISKTEKVRDSLINVNKEVITFNTKDSSCLFPGINTEDVKLKWKLKNDSLVIEEDVAKINEIVYGPLAYFNNSSYVVKDLNDPKYIRFLTIKESIELAKDSHPLLRTIKIYSGVYHIVNIDNSKLILTSGDLKMELVKPDKISQGRIAGNAE